MFTPSSLVKVHRPALDPVERGGDGGVQSVDEAARRQDRRGLECDGRDGRALGKVAVQRAGGLIRLIERERIEQRVALRVRVAAVVQRAAGAREGPKCPSSPSGAPRRDTGQNSRFAARSDSRSTGVSAR